MPKIARKHKRLWTPTDDQFVWQFQHQGIKWLASRLGRSMPDIEERLWSLQNWPVLRHNFAHLPDPSPEQRPVDPKEMEDWYADILRLRIARQAKAAARSRV